MSRALALIAEGALDGGNSSVERLAGRLGVGDRQLRRLFVQHLGATPTAVAQTRRVLFAKQLVHETALPMTQVALAAGFNSLRRFNEVFHGLFQRPPSSIRHKAEREPAGAAAATALHIRYRAPYDWESILDHLRARAIPGVEAVTADTYQRTIEVSNRTGFLEVAHLPRRSSLRVSIHFPLVQALPDIVNRVRRLFDLGADIATIEEHLSRDQELEPLITARPGLRAPGGWDGFELAVRAVLGQQVSVQAARQLAGKLVALHGRAVSQNLGCPGLTHVFPTAKRIATTTALGLGMPQARLDTIKALSQASAGDPGIFQPAADMEKTVSALLAIPGIGPWTAHYIALRAIREVDAFPASDAGLLRGAAKVLGQRFTAKTLERRAEAWRPWRAYAAQHLWAAAAPSPALSAQTATAKMPQDERKQR